MDTQTRKQNVFDDVNNVKKINEYKSKGDFDGLMDFFFELLDNNPQDIVTSKHSDVDGKMASMSHAITHFTEKEEYEKCQRISELVKSIRK